MASASNSSNEWLPIGHRKAFAWNHFSKHIERPLVKCNHCRMEYSKTTSTGILQAHLSNKHDISEKKKALSQPPITAFKAKDSIQMVISRMVTLDRISFQRMVKSKDIQRGLEAQGYKPPKTYRALSEMIIGFSSRIVEEMSAKFQKDLQSGFRFRITSDEYTSCGNKRYMNVNVHYNNETFNLGMEPINGSMPAEKGLKLLKKRLSKFGLDLDRDIITTVSDGASVMIKMMSLTKAIHQVSSIFYL